MQFNKSNTDNLEEIKKQRIEEQNRIEENLRKCLIKICSDNSGEIFLSFLNQICLWSEQDLNVDIQSLAYKKGRRDIWIMIRKFIPKETLNKIEVLENIKL